MSPVTTTTVDRRGFLQGVAAGGLVLIVTATGCERVSDALRGITSGSGGPPFEPAVYVRIGDDGLVTITVHRSEMGQGSKTTLAMAVADELEADWSKVRVEQAPGDEKKYGDQNTDGSSSVRNFLLPMREAGATGRAMLEAAAAQRWQVPVTEVKAEQNKVTHTGSGRTLSYASLVGVARTLPAPSKDKLRLKTPAEFRYIGKEMPIIDLFDMTTGRAQYGIDTRRPGMKYAVVMRPAVYGGTVATVNAAAAARVPGVERVVRLDPTPLPSGMSPMGGVAVIATSTWAAMQGRNALTVTWNDGPNGSYDSTTYRTELERSARHPGKVARSQGHVATALAGAARRLTADYYIPHLAHAQMEPVAAVADFKDGRCEIWAPTQSPQEARDEVAKALGVSTDNVRVNVTLLGGAFGRKSFPDFIIEAALLSRAVNAPVKVTWTREDDMQHDFFHSVASEHLEGGLDAHGRAVAWLHRSALPAIAATFTPNVIYQGDGALAQGMTDLPYTIPNLQLEQCPAVAHVRIGWYRSVINIPHAFAIGSFLDELAHAAHKDTKDFIVELLGPDHIVDMTRVGLTGKVPGNYGSNFVDNPIDTGRYRAVLELVADKAGWGQKLPERHGRGIAVHRSFLSYVASVVQVHVAPDGTLTIPRVDMAIDAGFIANPDRTRAQMEGATIMSLSNALSSEITFRNGRTEQSNFAPRTGKTGQSSGDGFRLVRMDESPREIHVHILPSSATSGGVGEPGVPPVAPALCNAIFAATGQRIRTLPVGNQLSGTPHARGPVTV